MAYLSLYRKWRPQTFADVVGQKHVVRTIVNALNRQRVAHAYLFCGPRGTGKTTVARLLAKGLNCKDGPTGTICNTCESCLEIGQGAALDVIEIDGASNRGIDEIREIRERVHYAPTQGRYKVYIVDEVHMLTNEAFNALLKMLEEPPAHVFFIFATTEAHKIPATIISRCQRFDFRNFQPEELLEQLKKVLDGEKVPYDIDALRLVARHAAGGMRDALAVLDQCIAYHPDEVNADVVQEVLGMAPRHQLIRFVQAHQHDDLSLLLTIVRELENDGVDLPEFIRDMMQYYRDLMMIKASGAKAEQYVHLLDEEKEEARELAQAFSLQKLVRSIEILGEVEDTIRWAPSSALAVEVACVKLVHDVSSAAVSSNSVQSSATQTAPAQTREGGVTSRGKEQSKPSAAEPTSASKATPQSKGAVDDGKRQPKPPSQRSDKREKVAVRPGSAPDASSSEDSNLQRLWSRLLETLRSERMRQIEAFLCEGDPVHVDDDSLIVVFPENRAFHHASMNSTNHRQTAEKLLSRLAGRPMKLQMHLGEAPEMQVSQKTASFPDDREAARNVSEQPKEIESKAKQSETHKDNEYEPIVTEALHIFDGTVVEVRREEENTP